MFFYRERTCEDSTEILRRLGRSFSRPYGAHAVTRLSAESKMYFLVVAKRHSWPSFVSAVEVIGASLR
jgi:hypothetical protein